MKIFARLDLIEYDKSASLKGEALDEEIRAQLEGLEFDGYELNDVNISRSASDNDEASELQEVADLMSFESVKHFVKLVEEGKANEQSALNDKFTNAQMLSWNANILVEQIQKRLDKLAEKKKTKKRRK